MRLVEEQARDERGDGGREHVPAREIHALPAQHARAGHETGAQERQNDQIDDEGFSLHIALLSCIVIRLTEAPAYTSSSKRISVTCGRRHAQALDFLGLVGEALQDIHIFERVITVPVRFQMIPDSTLHGRRFI